MRSTDHNLNNPLRVDDIELQHAVESWRTPTVKHVSQLFYDRLHVKDPNTIYVIDGTVKMYYGEHLIEKEKTGVKYLLGIDNTTDDRFVLYCNEVNGYHDNLIEIARFKDPQVAINILNAYSNTKYHINNIRGNIHGMIIRYVDEDISLSDLIIGIITAYGYQNDTRLQELVQTVITYHQTKVHIFDSFFVYMFASASENPYNDLFKIFNDLYNVILKYNFFAELKDKAIALEDISKPLAEMEEILRPTNLDSFI